VRGGGRGRKLYRSGFFSFFYLQTFLCLFFLGIDFERLVCLLAGFLALGPFPSQICRRVIRILGRLRGHRLREFVFSGCVKTRREPSSATATTSMKIHGPSSSFETKTMCLELPPPVFRLPVPFPLPLDGAKTPASLSTSKSSSFKASSSSLPPTSSSPTLPGVVRSAKVLN
jgi:hypothetical protein